MSDGVSNKATGSVGLGVGPSKMFSFDPAEFTEQFSSNGYVHIKGGASPEFMRWIKHYAFESFDGAGLEEFRIPNKKRQIRFPFPEDLQLYRSFRSDVAQLTSLPVDDVTLSESHVYFYDDTAAPRPAPHKDRFASQVSLGIPIVAPENSVVILYPQASRAKNHYNSTREWRFMTPEAERPENATRGLEPLVLDVRPGDVVAFLGSEIFHERWNAANTVTFYVKFNSHHLDPLGEDPLLRRQHQESSRTLEKAGDGLRDLRVELSPRIHSFAREYGRGAAQDVLCARVGSDAPTPLSLAEFEALQQLAGPIKVVDLAAKISNGTDPSGLIARAGQLVRAGVLVIAN